MADALFILGAAVWENGPSPTLLRRTTHAAKLWHAGAAPLLIPCGGLGKYPPSEAALMADILQTQGVPQDAIVLDDRSTTTWENIANAAKLSPGKSVIIVTDHYHAPRALAVARHLGLSARADCPKAPSRHYKARLREVLARAAYARRRWRQGKPDGA